MDRPAAWRSLAIDIEEERPFRVGGAAVDPVSRDADFAGNRERLQPQTLKVLIALARRKGKVVTRSELIDSCWEGRIVGEDVINRSISILRDFAERAGGFSIETVPKTGYRLVEAGGKSMTPMRRWLLPAGLLLLAGLAVVAAMLMRSGKPDEPPVPTVAIAPFDRTATEPATREIARAARASLSHMLSDSGFPVTLIDSPSGAPAATDFVISGDVQQAGDQVVATVRIEEAEHRIIIFTHRFEEPVNAAATLPDQIGASIAANLSWTYPLMVLDRRDQPDPRTTAELLTQMSLTVEGGDMLRSYQISREIAGKAPNSAVAQIALAFNSGFVLGDLPREDRAEAVRVGRIASERALRLAPEFGDVYAPWCFLHSQRLWAECEARLRTGMKVDPDSFARTFLETVFSDTGQFDDALEFARAAIANDRYKPAKLSRLIRDLEVTGHPEESAKLFARAQRWWPHNKRIYSGRLVGLLGTGNFEAIAELAPRASAEGMPLEPRAASDLAAAVRASDRSRARKVCGTGGLKFLDQLNCMVGLAQVGEVDAAFRRADELYPRIRGATAKEDEELWLDHPGVFPVSLLSAPSTAALRGDPRFVQLARNVGLLDYWRSGRLPDFCRKRPEPVCKSIARKP